MGFVIAARATTKRASCSQPEVCIGVSLKFFRINHRDEQIREQREGNETDDQRFHNFLPTVFAETIRAFRRRLSHSKARPSKGGDTKSASSANKGRRSFMMI